MLYFIIILSIKKKQIFNEKQRGIFHNGQQFSRVLKFHTFLTTSHCIGDGSLRLPIKKIKQGAFFSACPSPPECRLLLDVRGLASVCVPDRSAHLYTGFHYPYPDLQMDPRAGRAARGPRVRVRHDHARSDDGNVSKQWFVNNQISFLIKYRMVCLYAIHIYD